METRSLFFNKIWVIEIDDLLKRLFAKEFKIVSLFIFLKLRDVICFKFHNFF